MTSAEQVSRLLSLVPYLQAHPDADLNRTAELFAVTTGQLLADLDVLWYCGLPGGLPGDLIEIDMDTLESAGRIRLSNAEYLSRPLRFTAAEALSLVVALRAVRELAGSAEAAAVESAIAKLEAAAGSGVATALPRVALAGGSDEVRQVLAAAVADQTLVRLEYTDSGLATSTPKVAPARLLVRDGFGYLQAWHPGKEAWRTYRLDRISAVQRLSQQAPQLPEPPVFDAGWLEQRPEAVVVTLTLAESAAWVAEYYPIRAQRRLAQGIEVELLVADPAWLRSLLLRLGRQVLSVTPPEAATAARAAAADALAAYLAE